LSEPARQPSGAYDGSTPIVGRIPVPARQLVKAGVRGYATATSRWRPGPDFLVIGAKRAGTTTLYDALVRHPGVAPLVPRIQRIKSPHYFDLLHHRGPAWYRSHFPMAIAADGKRRLVGEAAPYLLYHPASPEWVADEAPGARLVVMLRDPVERAFSHHWDRVKNGVESLDFEAALAAESPRLAGESERLRQEPHTPRPAHEHFSYLDRGDYAAQLRRWWAHVPAEQMLILRSEDFYAEPGTVFGQICAFLGLAPWTPEEFGRHHAHADRPRVDPALRAGIWPQLTGSVVDLAELLGLPAWWDARGATSLGQAQVVVPRPGADALRVSGPRS
jgi:hypothetical protein